MRGLMPAKRSEFQLALARDCLRMLQGHVEIPRVNDQRLLDHVVGADGSEEGFLSGGFLTAVGLMSMLQLAGRPIPPSGAFSTSAAVRGGSPTGCAISRATPN